MYSSKCNLFLSSNEEKARQTLRPACMYYANWKYGYDYHTILTQTLVHWSSMHSWKNIKTIKVPVFPNICLVITSLERQYLVPNVFQILCNLQYILIVIGGYLLKIHVFVYGLLNNAVNSSDNIVSNDGIINE